MNIIDFEQANSVGWVEHPVNEKDWTPVKRSAWAGVNKLLRTLEPFQYPQDGNLYHPPPPTFSIKVEGKTTTQIVEISEPTGLATVDYRLFRFERREYISEILRLLREGQ